MGGRDDDEYVRVESADEEEDEPHIKNKNEIPRGTPVKANKPAAFGSANKNVASHHPLTGYDENKRDSVRNQRKRE